MGRGRCVRKGFREKEREVGKWWRAVRRGGGGRAGGGARESACRMLCGDAGWAVQRSTWVCVLGAGGGVTTQSASPGGWVGGTAINPFRVGVGERRIRAHRG